MEKQKFNITINAPREKVWQTLWNLDSYRAWTSVFAEGSTMETEGSNVEADWQKGSKVLFTDGKGSGMVSRIADKVPNEYMSFEHLGMVENGVEDTTSEKVKDWAGAMENYTLKDVSGKTELLIDIDITDDHKDYFMNAWPKALDKVKELAEKN